MSVSSHRVVNDIQPTHEQFETKREDKELAAWSNVVDGVEYSQEPFLEYGPTFVNATCGLGAGKTVMGIIRAVANAEYWNPGYPGMIISPTVPNLKNAILPEMRKWGILDDWEYKGKGSDEPGLHSPNGTRIILESADNDRKIGRLRGPSVAWVWMDEPAEIAPRAFEVAIGRVRTGHYQNIFVTGTPKGKNWVYHKFHPEGDNQLDDVLNLFEIPSFANPHNPESYHQILNQYEGEFYKQEALGQFVDFEGLVYKWFGKDHKISIDDVPDTYDETVYAIDPGGANPTAVLCLVREGDYWYVVDEFYERRVVNEDIRRELQAMEEQWGNGVIYSDHEPRLIDELQKEGFNVKPADKEVTDGIRHVSGKRDTFRVLNSCQNTINEFEQYQYKDDSQDKPLKQNDHLMDALRYALYTHEDEPDLLLGYE